ncbi:efflux RND transporter permease subunit [Alteromonas halophila]|uniref:Membrane protein n=1 Tax=Alteromonas halophila TaxID=516698 RepID=A0A918JNX4_9ALTE|nr:MMPL family transporter [Alteromonas halophila]GGW89976.1 membrane protein [Alteromonas halophila]
MNERIAAAIVKARFFIIGVFAIALGLAVMYAPSFKINASADTLLVKNNELYIKTQVANQTFAPEEFILLAYEPTAHALYSQQTFTDIQALSEQVESLSRVKSVTSILNIPLVTDASSLQGTTDVDSLTWEAQQYSASQMKERIDGHPIFTDLLVNRESTATAIQIVFQQNETLSKLESQITDLQRKRLDGTITEADEQTIIQLKAQADPIRQKLTKQRAQEIAQIEEIAESVNERANTYLGGSYVVGQHLIDIIKSDLTVFGGAIAGVIALMLAVLYRSVKWVVFPLIACASSVVLTMGLLSFLDMRATVLSANFIALQIILTLAVMIHLIGSYRSHSHADNASGQHDRVRATLGEKLSPCFYATLTTSVGFGSLLFSGLQPVADFGLMMLYAMIITMLVSLLLFPSLLSLLPVTKESGESKLLKALLGWFRRISLRSPGMLAAACIGIFAVAAIGIMRLDVENSFINYFDKQTQVYQELAFIDQQFGGSTPMDIILDVGETNDSGMLVLEAESVAQLQLVQAAVEAFEATGSVTSVVNFTELAKQLNDGKPLTEYELTSIYRLLDDKVVDQLVGAYFSPVDDKLRIAVRIQDTTAGLDRETFLTNLKSDLGKVGINEGNYALTSLFVLYQDILSRLISSQVITLGIVYGALFIVLLAVFRRFGVALIAMIPNILTTLGILGVIGWLGIPLDIMTITIAAIAMGIAVDDTIHFVHAYLRGAKQGDGSSQADTGSRYAFGHTAVAMSFTTLIIVAGFSLFGLSDFLPSVYFGLLTAGAMFMAWFSDVTLLPAMLNMLYRRKTA